MKNLLPFVAARLALAGSPIASAGPAQDLDPEITRLVASVSEDIQALRL